MWAMRASIRPFCLACLAAILFAAEGRAQIFSDRVLAPAGNITSGARAHMLALNPSAMTLTGGWEVEYMHAEVAGGQGLVPGTGDAVYGTARVFGPLYLGLGFEFVRPPSAYLDGHLGAGYSAEGWAMGVFAIGARLGKMLSLGTSVRAWISPTDHDRMHGLAAWDVALHLHPCQYFSFLAAVYDLNAPSKGGMHPLAVERTWGMGMAVRPLGRDLLTIGVDNFVGERSRNDTLRLSLEGQIVRGVGIAATASLLFGDDYPMAGSADGDLFDVQVALALRIDTSHVGIWSAAHLTTMQTGDGFDGGPVLGWLVGIRISGQRYKTVLAPRRYVPVPLEGDLEASGVAAWIIALDALSRDPLVDGLIVEPRSFAAPPGAIQDLREAIERVREKGKHVVCHADEATASAYYLCTAGDRIYIGPAGGVRLSGYSMRLVFFTGLLEKLGVNAQIVRIGEYKSYPEQFTLKSPSAPALEQDRELLGEVWSRIVADVAAGRGMDYEKAASILEEGPFNAGEAVANGLADAVVYSDEVESLIEEDLGRRILVDSGYWSSSRRPDMWSAGKKKVAVLVVGGGIVEGKSRSIPLVGISLAGDKSLVKALDSARTDPSIGAVVLRVESGGGSSIASDRIWRAVHRLAQKKPVVASIGGVAASGGYYIVAPATEIYANPSSVTGSIGLFYGKADLSGLLSKLGISVTVLSEGGDRTDMDSWHRPYTPEEVAFLEKELDHFYNVFLARVSSGRGMTKEEVDEIGRGRVWSGSRAGEKRLVDRLGGLSSAIDRARELGKVPAWVPVVDITPGPGLFEKIVGKFTGAKQGSVQDLAALLAQAAGLGAVYPLAAALVRRDPAPIALCPLILEM